MGRHPHFSSSLSPVKPLTLTSVTILLCSAGVFCPHTHPSAFSSAINRTPRGAPFHALRLSLTRAELIRVDVCSRGSSAFVAVCPPVRETTVSVPSPPGMDVWAVRVFCCRDHPSTCVRSFLRGTDAGAGWLYCRERACILRLSRVATPRDSPRLQRF